MANPKNLKELHRQLAGDGVVKKGYENMVSLSSANGKEGMQNRRMLYNIATEGGYYNGSYADFHRDILAPSMVKAPGVSKKERLENQEKTRKYQEQRRQQARQVSVRQQPAQQQKPAAAPQGQKPKPVQATPQKPAPASQQYTPTYPDPTASNGQISRVRPPQGTGVLKRDSQIMADDSLSAEDKVALINDNRSRRGQRQRTFNGPAYEETARNMGVVADNPVEDFTESVEAGFQPDHFFTDSEGNVLDYKPDNYVNKSPVTQYNDRIKEIADEINYYNTKQDQGGGGTTRIEDAINDAYARFVKADDERMSGAGGYARMLASAETGGVTGAIERGSLREKYAGLDAVAEAAYNSFPDEVKQKYGEDAVYSAIYQATLSAMQENARPKNYGEYLAQKLVSTVPAILYKAAVRANAGGRTTLSDIADIETAKYEQELDKQGFVGQVKQGIGTGVSFVADPTMYIPFGGGAGNLVGRGIASVAAKQAVGRGLEAGAVKLASKAAGSKIISRGLVHGVSGGVQMAAYEEALGLANMANGSGQNFWDVTGEALETGAIMVPLGFVSQGARVVKGRTATAIADKGLSRGKQWAANTGAKLGINTTAFIAEAGIFASPDLIKMAVNGTYTNEQARDVVNHSIASLAGIKVAGAFNPTHIEQTIQQVRSVVKGTMGTELAIDRHDREALERLGYPKIQGDNIMSLFMPLGERPQAKDGGGYFSMYSQIVLDERVPWSTRAKLIYVATGMLPETGVRPNSVRKTTDENGRIVVTTLQGNNPISQRFFDKKHSASADSYLRKVSHDVERMNFEGTKQDITNEYLGGIARSQLLNDALAKDPKTRTPEEQKLVDDYNHELWVATDLMAGYARRTVMYDDKLPDPEKALKKPAWERSEQEQRAVERYGVALNNKLDEIRSNNYSQIALDLADKDSFDATKEMSNKQDGFLYQCQLRGEEGVWYTVVDFDGTIEQGETGIDVTPGANGDKMMVRNMSTGETKMVTLAELTTLSTDRYFDVRNSLTETFYNNYLNSFLESRRKLSFFGKQPQNAEEGERLTLAADNVDPTTGLRPEYTVINKDGNSGTYIVEDAQGNRKLINGHDILQKITDTEQQIPTQINPQVPPTGPQTPPPAAPAQEPPVQPQGEAPAMPEQGTTFKLKVGDEFVDAEVTGKDDTGIIVRYEQNGTFRTEHLTPEELAPRLEQQEAPAAPVTPPAPATNEGEGGAPAAPENGIPEDENGNKLFHKAEPKAVEDYFKNEKGYDDRFILAIADKRITEAQKDLADAGAKREKAYADVDEQAMDEAIAAERDAQERLDWWNKFKEGYGKEEQPAGEQSPVVEGGGQPPVQEGEGGEQPPVAEGGEEPDIPRDWRDDVPAEARKRGYIMDGAGGKIMRQEPFEEPKGNTTQVNFGGKAGVVNATFDIVESDTVQESHINGQENPLHFFIREAQPKERTDKASQKAANATANNIRPEEITTGATAYSGAPVVNARREVIQGNGRENALHNAYANGTAEEYRQYLIDNAELWGIDPEAVRKMKKPQLVRVIDVPDERAIELGLMDDKDIGTGGKQYVDPKTLIAKIDGPFFSRLMDAAFEGMLEGDSFADALRKNGKAVLELLVSKGLINETQMTGLMNADGTLTKEGRDTLTEMVLMPLFDGAPASLRSKWESSAIPERAKTALIKRLARLSRLEDKSVIEDIRKAVSLLYEMRDVRDANTWKKFVHKFNEWGGQVDMQHPEPAGKDYTPEQVRMAGAIKFVLQKKLEGFFGKIYSEMYKDPLSLGFEDEGGKPKPVAYKTAFDEISDIITPEEIKDFSARPEGSQAEQGERPAGGSGKGKGSGQGERPATPPTPPTEPETPQEPQGGGEPPKGEGEPPKPEEPGKPAGEPAGGPAASGPHQLTVDEINGLNLSQSTKENAIDYVNGDRGPRARVAYAVALKEWERVNGKSGEGKPETPPTTPEDNGPQEPPKGSGTTGRGGGKPSTPRSGGKPAEPKPAEPKPESEGPKDSGDDIDLGGLDELGGFEGLFGKRKPNESRRPSREGEIVNEARYIPEEATEEQNKAVEKVIDVLADIGKQCLEKKGMRTQSELVDFMRQTEAIRKALDRIGFDEEDKSNLYNDMWGARVNTPKGSGLPERMRLSEYAEALSKTDKPKQDDKPKQIVSPMEPTVKNVVYKPNSKGKTNESIIPASMVQAVKTALGKINGGDTDGFVMDKVGFENKDELYNALNAEQIDGVALAISAIERGEGLILGDMTGIGKGRQLAAVIRYARKEGIRPVFVTEKPGLFKDMMRDLLDVGADTPFKPFRPLILASGSKGDVTLADGSKVKAADAQTIEKLLSGDLDKLAQGYDALFVTYSNTNNVESDAFFKDQEATKKSKTHNENTETKEPPELTKKKLNLIAKWARGSIVVMDEAHNAAGDDSNQSVQWREIIDTTSGVNAKGVVMASATYAKTPKNYVLYSLRTPIKEAHLSSAKLEEVFAKGGVPLQEWLAGQLTGESYIRRERDMTGVNFDYRICVDGYDMEHPEKSTPEAIEKVKAIRKANDRAAKIANTLLALDNKASEEIKKIKEALAPSEKSGKAPMAVRVLVEQADGTYKEQTIDPRNYPEKLKVTTSTFASRISDINAQLFMAEKAESAADAAIKAIEDGELPMIVFENTFDSLMDELPVDEKGVLSSADYAQAFVRYLERLGNFKVRLPKYNANGAQEVFNCRIDLSKNPDFYIVKNMIENEGVGLHVSPVDRIRERIEEAGYKVGELSGREYSIQKLPDGKYHKTRRVSEDADKVTDDYNTGKIDVLMINASGSTGRSMHEKGTFGPNGEKIPGTTQNGDKMLMKPRRQIYVQNFNNETTMVQAMGRIDRTGQVEHGRYTFLMTPVPAETNILMRAQRKREQLKANTTAQQDRNSFDAVNASDFINKYGDEVVAEYLEKNPKVLNALQLKKEDLREGTGKAKAGLSKTATSHAYTLTCDQQQEFYDDVQAAYDEYVKVLKENGDYDLETQVVDLQAETIAEHMFVRGSHESDSMFSQDTNIARCRVKVQRKPMKLEEIEQHVNEVAGTDNQYERQKKFQEKFDKHFADMEAEVIKEFEAKEQNVDNDGKKNDKLGKIRAFKLEAQRIVDDFPLNLLMPFYADASEAAEGQGMIAVDTMPHAIVYDIKLGRTLNSSTIVFAVNDGRQKVAVRMNDDNTIKYLRRLQITPGDTFKSSDWNKTQGDSYEDAFIITGNLIGAYHNDLAEKGRMIRYTDNEGNVHTGILMPRNFKTSQITVEKPISEFFNTLMSLANAQYKGSIELPKFANGNLEIEDTRHYRELRFTAKGDGKGGLAKSLKEDPDLNAYRTGKTTNKYVVRGEDAIRRVLGILAGRYGVTGSAQIDPVYFMSKEEREAEAEARMFRVNPNIEDAGERVYQHRWRGKANVVHVPEERMKNVDASSDWYDNIIKELADKGLYGLTDKVTTNKNGKRVFKEFIFQNRAMAEEFIKMVNDEPAKPLIVDERANAAEPNWEEVDRSQHTYQLSDSSYLTGEDIAKTFGFRNVDTGYMRDEQVRDFYNAFMTMAMLLNIDPKSISLGGNMDVKVLNPGSALKELGPGVGAAFRMRGETSSYTGVTQKDMAFIEGYGKFPLAHEWLHALDNYFGTFGLRNEETGYYEQTRLASESSDRDNRPWTAREEMREAWNGLLRSLVESGFFGRLENEHFFKGTNFTDSKERPKYWGMRTEMLARAFEPYLRKKIAENKDNLSLWANLYGGSWELMKRMQDMISDGNTNYTHGKFDPTTKEQAVIDKAFDKFFETIRERRDVDTGRVIMYEQAKPGETKREATMRETRNLNRVLAKTGLANSVTVESERDFAEGVFASTGRPMRTLDGIVYGYTDSDGNIHLNAKYLNFETPIHEYGHLWSAWAKKNHGDLWQRGIELAKESDAFKKLKEESKKKGSVYNGMTDDQLADEVLADAIGKKGQDMYDPKDWTRTARVRHWLTQLWHRIGEALGFRKRMPNMAVGDMSFDDIIRTAAGDILSGKRIKGAEGRRKGVYFQSRNTAETYTNLDGNEAYRETREDGTIDREITTMSDGSKMAEWFDENGHVREELRYYPNGEVSRVRNYDENGELTRQISYDENRHIISRDDFRTDTHLERDENGIMRGMSNGVELKPYNFRFQQAPANNPAGSQQGNNEQLHIAREYAQDRTRTTTKLYEEVVENSVSLRHVLEDIARKSGKPIADYENVYLAENQSHGMMTTELITFRDRRVQPLLDHLRKLAKNYGGEPTKNYVWARHGIERSIYICFRERAYELAEKEAEAAARARGEEVTDKDINDAYNAMLDELYNATSGYSRRAYLENLETECSNILSAHGDTKPFEVTDKAGLTALNDKRSLVDDKPIENAWEIVKEYENNAGAEGETDVEALFDRLNDISKSMLDYSRDKGMMDKDTVEKIRKMFRFYVPLQGFAEGTMAQDYFEYMDSNPMRAGRAVPNTPKMRGRGSESADSIATLVRNAEMTIAAARRNTVATHLYNLATSRKTDLFAPARAWEAYDAAEDTWVPSTPDFTGCETTKDMMDAIRLHDEQMRQQRELGLAREARRGFSNRLITAQGAPKGLKMSMRQRHEHAVPVRINGKENVIYVLSDPRIAQIVNGTDKGSVDKNNAPFFYQANKLKRIQSGLMTSYNIAFWFANGARDIQNAFLRQAIMNGGGAAARTATQGLKGDPLGIIPWEAMRLYNKAVKGTLDENKKHERYFKEFFEHGGITGYAFADQVEKIQSRVKKLLEHPKTNPRRLMFAVGELMEKAGGAFEIAPRFATYVASRDGGKSVMQSVADAKEATVNFDRRGARRSWAMRAAAAFYAFLNPGIQGMQNRLHQVRTHPGKTSVLHAIDFAMGYLWKGIAVACLAAMGRKDDEYDTQLTEYDRRNNICFPVGDDDWVKIPINMEDRVIWGLGDAVRNGMDFFPGNRYIGGEGKDEYDDNEDWMKYAGIVSAWFPIDIGSENNFIPTSLQPIYDIYINRKDFRGQSVDWRNENNAQKPEYQRINPYVTGKMWTDASKWWSEFNGGDEVTRAQNRALHGWDEINPQHMQYLFQSYLGGIGTTIGQVMSLAETAFSDDDDVKWNSFKFPIANRFWKGNPNEYSASKDERKKATIWKNWAEEVIRKDREYRKLGAEHDDETNTLSQDAKVNYEENLKYLELAKEIKKLNGKKSQAKSKATKEGRTLTKDEESEYDNAFMENIPDFEQKFLDIDGKRKVPEFRKHYDDD